jgi:hypothetical protein
MTPQEWIRMQNFPNREEILDRMRKDAEFMANQAQSQPPKIVPNGEISFSLASKDPNVILDTLQQAVQYAQLDQQHNAALQQLHADNGMNVVGSQPGSASSDPNAPQGTTGALAMQKMAQGR